VNRTGLSDFGIENLPVAAGVSINYARLNKFDAQDYVYILSKDELDRAERLRPVENRQRFMKGRGLLRIVLGKFLDVEPGSIEINATKNGKPVLAENNRQKVNFNISHSRDLLVIAISDQSQIGIDVEYFDPRINPRQASSVAFSPAEIEFLKNKKYLAPIFFEIWTCKEAILKATGAGFSYPSNRFSVISAGSQSIMPWIKSEITHEKKCDLYRFSLSGEYIGALAEFLPKRNISASI
jgi:phosphopantetheinyl transferase